MSKTSRKILAKLYKAKHEKNVDKPQTQDRKM